MNSRILIAVALLPLVSPIVEIVGQEQKTESRIVRIGGVAYKPEKVTIFKNLKTLLNRKGFNADFVLYSDYDAMNDALRRGEVDVAWNSPGHHATFHVNAGGSQSLAMRDVDQDRVTLVALEDSKIKSLKDLAGKRLILGDAGHQEGAPTHYLKKEGVDIDSVTLVEVQKNDAAHVLNALREGRSDAAVVLESSWKRAKAFREANAGIKAVWNSPEICHCTFTAAQDFDAKLGSQFTQIITNLDLKDPLVAELNRLEGSKRWLPGNPDGFEVLVHSLSKSGSSGAKKVTPKARSKDVVRIAGTAYSPQNVTKFQNLKTLFNRKGFPLDFVLYSDHKAQVDALARGEVNMMFSSPVPHAMYHLRAGGSQTLAMRDVDKGLRVTLVARAGSNIKSLRDLDGKRVILGSRWNAEGALLPVHYLKQEGVELDKLKKVILPDRDSAGRRANTAQHVLTALSEGRGDAAVVLEESWKTATAYRRANPTIKQVWTSPEFCHCTITAPQGFDAKLGGEFTRIITNMDPKDPLVAELNRLVDAEKWIPGEPEGFKALYEALENKDELLREPPRNR